MVMKRATIDPTGKKKIISSHHPTSMRTDLILGSICEKMYTLKAFF